MTLATISKPKMKFRLLAGNHLEQTGENADRSPIIRRYAPGDIIETTLDLEKRFNAENARKFERLNEDTHQPAGVFWDSSKETLEQFTERMKAAMLSKPITGEASKADPGDSKHQVIQANAIGISPVQAAAEAGFDPKRSNTGQTSPPLDDRFGTLSLKELLAFAAEEEIDLKGAKSKEDVLKVVRGATKAGGHG